MSSLNVLPSVVDIKAVKKFTINSLITTQGIVSVEPNIFSDNSYYIQDTASGIKVIFKDFPNIHSGNFVKVTGYISQVNNETIINQSDFIQLGTLDSVVPILTNINNLNIDNLGQVVNIQGKIIDIIDSKNIIIKDDTSAIEISTNLLPSSLFMNINLKKNILLNISGILTNNINQTYKLLPRYSNDIKEINSNLANTGSSLFTGIIGGIFILIALYIINYKIKRR